MTDSMTADLELLSQGDAPENTEVDEVTETNEPEVDNTSEGEEGEKEETSEPESEEKKVETKPEEEKEPETEAPVVNRPSISDLKKEYPDLFKKFPGLRDIYFREKEFANFFPTVSSAREAAESVESFQAIQNDILEGDGSELLKSIHAVGENSLEKFSSNFLPSLYKVNKEAHWNAIAPVLENATKAFLNEGKRRGDENIVNAALHLSEYLFGDSRIASGAVTIKPKEENNEEKIRQEERQRLNAERFKEFELSTRAEVYQGLKSEIEKALESEKDLTSFVRNSIIEKVIEEVGSQLQADKAHIGYMDSLWRKAESRPTPAEKSSIINAYLARAKQVIPGVRNRFLTEARGVSGVKKQPANSGKPTGAGNSGSVKSYKPHEIDWSRTSDADFLNGNVTLRK